MLTLKIKFYFLFFIFFVAILESKETTPTPLPTPTQKKDLPLLITKQQLSRLRLITNNGKYTYYQNHSGGLNLSTNYNVNEILKGNEESTFSVTMPINGKKILIEHDENTYTDTTFMKNKSLYISDLGGLSTEMIGSGMNPIFHLEESWVTFYEAFEKRIHFKKLNSVEKEFTIQLQNKINPFFTPQVLMVNDQDTLFTDINSQGVFGLLYFQRNSKKIIPLVKAPRNGIRIEVCLKNDYIFVGFFAYPEFDFGSEIFRLNIQKTRDFSKMEQIYKSTLSDPGQIVCSIDPENLYFIKTFKEKNLLTTEAVQFNISKRQMTTLSNLEYVTQLQEMDGTLLIPFHDRYYVVKGERNFTQDSLKEVQENP